MTFTVPLFGTTPIAGTFVSNVYSPSTATSSAFVPEYPSGAYGGFAPGQTVDGNDGSRFLMVTVSTSCNPGDVCCVVPSSAADVSFTILPLTATVAASSFGRQLGVSLVTGTTATQIWLQTRGYAPLIGTGAAACTANVPLFTSTTAGKLVSGTTTTAYPVYGITLSANASSTNGSTAGVITSIELGLIATTATTPPYAAF